MARNLVFVEQRSDMVSPGPADIVVVLDPAWTPERDELPQLRPSRALFARVVERYNVFDESLERLDRWAEAAGAADLFSSGGVTWWYHARGFLRLNLHEMLVWCHVLEDLAAEGPFDRIAVPELRPALVAAARASAAVDGSQVVTQRAFVPLRVILAMRWTQVAAIALKVRRRVRHYIDPRFYGRYRQVSRRIDDLAREGGGILAVERSLSFHVIDDGSGAVRGDPYVSPVLGRLAHDGHRVTRVAIGLDHRKVADWPVITADPRLVPFAAVERRFRPTSAERREAAAIASRIRAVRDVPLPAGRVDLGPAFSRQVAAQGKWFARQRLAMASAERFMRHLHVTAMITGWEAARTSWLGGARRVRIPSVAVQHGVIYRNTPDYVRPSHRALVKPDLTCLFGEYERDLLIRDGHYDPATVLASGSPRSDPEQAAQARSVDERLEVRRSLGVAETDRMLVVSTARNTVGDLIHGMSMVGRILGAPLPGIHIVFKLHPEEAESEHYRELLAGIARADGYAPPPMSVVRDIDIYRLLRAADAHLGQYSTVLTDAVLTETPNMIAVGQAWSDIIGYVDAGVATPVCTPDDVRAFMADPQPAPREARRRFLEAHYRSGDAVGRIAEAVADLARR